MPINATPKKKKVTAPFTSAPKADSKPSAKMPDYGINELTSDFSAQIIQGFVEDGLSSLQYGGHVNFGDGISVPYLIGGWGEQVVDPNDDWSQITK
jgi:hypothetical protein